MASHYSPITGETTAAVAPLAEGYEWGDGRMELLWDEPTNGERYATSVTVFNIGNGVVRVGREGKGDWLTVDLVSARRGMTAVYLSDDYDTPVATLGIDHANDMVAVTFAGREGFDVHDTEESALVALAFWYVS